MGSSRTIVMAILVLSASAPWLAAEEARPNKLRLVHHLKNPDERFASGGFLPDGRLLLAGDNYIRRWNPKTGKEDARFPLKFAKPHEFHFVVSPDGKTVAVMPYAKKEIRFIDVASAKVISRVRQRSGGWSGLFAPDGKTFFTRGPLCLLDVKTGKELWELRIRVREKWENNWETNHSLAFSPDGKILAVGLERGSVYLCDAATGTEIRRLFRPVSWCQVPNLAFSPDGRYLVAHAYEDRIVIRLWDVRSGKLMRVFEQPHPPPFDRKFMMELMYPDSKARKLYRRKYKRDSWGLAFSPDGKTVANCGSVSQLWEVASGQLRHEFEANTSEGCFSPDGRFLAAYCSALNPEDGKWTNRDGIRLWNWRDPCLKQPPSLGPHDNERLWNDLASTNASVGYRAIATLLTHPQLAVPVLNQRLRRVEVVEAGELDRLLEDLDADRFTVRQKAKARLVELGPLARPALLRVLKQRPSLEVRHRIEEMLDLFARTGVGPEALRCLRAVEVLESIGSPDARQVLTKLASGADGTVQTQDAKAALKRLEQR